ncbi:hypothetical protein EBU24_03055 [bacterium]|nr:hypothetical protein [bacterium]
MGSLHQIGNSIDSVGAITASSYAIYNETITCDTSEAGGTFSLTYNATIKGYDNSLSPLENAVIHSYTRNETISEDTQRNVSIVVQGTVQGLIPGGFIQQNLAYELPNTGPFIKLIDSDNSKYKNASSFYYARIGTSADINETFKSQLDISGAALLAKTSNNVKPSSFSLDHSYTAGTVQYNATYTTQTARSQDSGYTTVSISRNEPIDIVQEFVIPGRAKGPIIQKLNMKTPKTISINISGASKDNKKSITKLEDINLCNSLPTTNIPNLTSLTQDTGNWIVTKKDFTSNPIDGSFSISLEYTCKGA